MSNCYKDFVQIPASISIPEYLYSSNPVLYPLIGAGFFNPKASKDIAKRLGRPGLIILECYGKNLKSILNELRGSYQNIFSFLGYRHPAV